MDTRVNNLKTLIGQSREFVVQTWLQICFTANELIFAEYCEFHACRKRERKSDYQRRYRVFGDTGKSGQLLPMRGLFRPGTLTG